MASTDFAPLSDNTAQSVIASGPVTSAVIPAPNGGGAFTYGIHSLSATPGVVGFYSALANFTPTAKAGDIASAIIKSGVQGSNHSEFVFVNLNGQASTNLCYMLGLSNTDPAHIILVKGQLAGGLPDVAPGTQGVLRRSTATYPLNTWVQVKLEAILQPNGDIVLNCYASSLAVNLVTAPVWVAIPGMAAYTDDFLQSNTGSAPLASGRMGWAMVSSDINRTGAFDEIQTDRQILP
jgi:hypothetical protein